MGLNEGLSPCMINHLDPSGTGNMDKEKQKNKNKTQELGNGSVVKSLQFCLQFWIILAQSDVLFFSGLHGHPHINEHIHTINKYINK